MEHKIFEAIIELVSIINRSDRDQKMIERAGVHLDPAAFRVLVGIGHLKATSVGDLADKMGRNYSSISRQIDKLEAAGLVKTYPSAEDSRIRVSELSEKGKEIYSIIQSTRKQMMSDALSDWKAEDKAGLLNGLTRLIDSINKFE